MTKKPLLDRIIAALVADLATLTSAARQAHAGATHEECIADNKYDTTSLEASYIAQGQANRAAEIRRALERYRGLTLLSFSDQTPIRLTALVTLEAEDGRPLQVFLGPDAGGLKISWARRSASSSPRSRPSGGRCWAGSATTRLRWRRVGAARPTRW